MACTSLGGLAEKGTLCFQLLSSPGCRWCRRDVGVEELPFSEWPLLGRTRSPAQGTQSFILFEQHPWYVLKTRIGGFCDSSSLLGFKQTLLLLLQYLCWRGEQADKTLFYSHGFQLDKAPSTEQPLKRISELSQPNCKWEFLTKQPLLSCWTCWSSEFLSMPESVLALSL